MRSWLRALALAVVFTIVGAFGASLWLEIRHETPAESAPPPGVWSGRRIRVEVLNGAGVRDLAARATRILRDRQFDVVYLGNIEPFGRDSSLVIARVAELEPARRVADVLGVRRVTHEPDRNLYLDVTVILGVDWPEAGTAGGVQVSGRAAIWWSRVRRAAGRLWPG